MPVPLFTLNITFLVLYYSIAGLKFNTIDGKIDRRSHMGDYQLDEDDEDTKGRPM